MKRYFKLLSVCAIVVCSLQASKAQELTFDFDAAGNQTVRQFVCVGCSTYSSAPFYSSPVSLMTSSTDNKTSSGKQRTLIAYPNPVTEILTLKWDSYDYYIKAVAVSSVTGARVYKQDYPYVEGQQQVAIPFSGRTPGMYVINVIYSDATQDAVKVIKVDR